MKFAYLTKRNYTNKDLLDDKFGRLFHLPVQLHGLGHEGIVIAGDLHSRRKECKQLNGILFHSTPLSISSFFPFIRYFHLILKEFKPDVLLASGDSYFGYLGLAIARGLKIPFIFDVYDDYTAFGTNKFPGMKSLFYKTVESANLVVTSSELLRKKLSSFNKNILVIENGFDPGLFHSLSKKEVRAKLEIPLSDTVVGYFGSITKDLGIEVLLSATKILGKQIPNLRLLLAGHNGFKWDSKPHFIDYRGFLSQQKIPALINACDVVVIPYLPSKQVQLSNACKIAEYIACAVPIVATNVSNHKEIFADAPQSLCEPGNSTSMASAIQAQLKSPEVLQYPTNLTWVKLAEKLSYSFKKITKSN